MEPTTLGWYYHAFHVMCITWFTCYAFESDTFDNVILITSKCTFAFRIFGAIVEGLMYVSLRYMPNICSDLKRYIQNTSTVLYIQSLYEPVVIICMLIFTYYTSVSNIYLDKLLLFFDKIVLAMAIYFHFLTSFEYCLFRLTPNLYRTIALTDINSRGFKTEKTTRDTQTEQMPDTEKTKKITEKTRMFK